MSQLETPAPQLDIYPLLGTIEQLHEIANTNPDPLEKLRIYAAVGKMATGALEVRDLLMNTPSSTELGRTAVNGEVKHSDHPPSSPLHLVDTSTKEPYEPEPMEPVEAEALPTLAQEISDDPTHILSTYFPGLRFRPRDKLMMLNLMRRPGEVLKSADINAGQEWDGDSARNQATSTFIRKLVDSPYGKYLERTGTRVHTRYIWSGPALSEAVTLADTPASAPSEPEVQPAAKLDAGASQPSATKERPEEAESEMDIISKFRQHGLEYDDKNGQLNVRGVPVRMNALSRAILKVMVEAGGKTDFKTLLRDENLTGYGTSSNFAHDLNAALVAIDTELKRHEITWSDRQFVDDGKKIRKLQLGTGVPTPADLAPAPKDSTQPDFLATGL